MMAHEIPPHGPTNATPALAAMTVSRHTVVLVLMLPLLVALAILSVFWRPACD